MSKYLKPVEIMLENVLSKLKYKRQFIIHLKSLHSNEYDYIKKEIAKSMKSLDYIIDNFGNLN